MKVFILLVLDWVNPIFFFVFGKEKLMKEEKLFDSCNSIFRHILDPGAEEENQKKATEQKLYHKIKQKFNL
jgi:hypothetical protein